MKQYKKLIYGIAVGSLISLAACTDLTESVYDKLTDESIDTSDSDVVG